MKILGARAAANILLIGLGALLVFHILMLAGLLPSGMAWGGRATEAGENLTLLESIAVVVTLLFAATVAAKAGYLRVPVSSGAVRVAMWITFAYFALNVVGNLASTSSLERAIFTPVSIVLALSALRLALE